MDKAAATADALELFHLNQTAIRAALEELSLWVSQRGSIPTHNNVLAVLEAIDVNAEGLQALITQLRQGCEG